MPFHHCTNILLDKSNLLHFYKNIKETTENEILIHLTNLKRTNLWTGPYIFKACPDLLIYALQLTFSLILIHFSKIFEIHKSGETNSILNYTLLAPSKIFEGILYKNIFFRQALHINPQWFFMLKR